jgi:hypothetical protein
MRKVLYNGEVISPQGTPDRECPKPQTAPRTRTD